MSVSGSMVAKPCIIGKEYHGHRSAFRVDPCTDCTCLNGTAVCTRHTCPVLTCGTRALPPQPGKCCPECPQVEEAKAACIVAGKTYQVCFYRLIVGYAKVCKQIHNYSSHYETKQAKQFE
jgi:hypothetical protein